MRRSRKDGFASRRTAGNRSVNDQRPPTKQLAVVAENRLDGVIVIAGDRHIVDVFRRYLAARLAASAFCALEVVMNFPDMRRSCHRLSLELPVKWSRGLALGRFLRCGCACLWFRLA